MYEEPYRWVEAVGNRRQYLDEQFKQGSPVVALTYEGGILLTTVSKGKEQPVCSDESESCWQRNRRGHPLITAK